MKALLEIAYLAAAVLFVAGLKWMSSPQTARQGNLVSAAGMLLAVVVTLLRAEVVSFHWIAAGLLLGTGIGVWMARSVALTAMPETVALLNGFGGLASLCVAWAEELRVPADGWFTAGNVALSVFIGGVTFSGSVLAWAKLSGRTTGRPVQFTGQKGVNVFLSLAALAMSIAFTLEVSASRSLLAALACVALAGGVLFVLPIGGADMPVVVSLLNSFSGVAAATTGFVLQNTALIVTGALVGASGLILTQIMCKGMNRSLGNVLFSAFGAATSNRAEQAQGSCRSISISDAFVLLEAARSVVVVPGYGLAVAQAQHALRELGDLLAANGAEVVYAIHPVAGRMPGHLNVILSEANVPYDELIEVAAANSRMGTVDVCLVIGANDIVNPAARDDKDSPIRGMPIINADHARTVLVLKRSLSPGFAGIDNALFTKPNTRLLFGDAKASLQGLIAEFDREKLGLNGPKTEAVAIAPGMKRATKA